MGIGVVDGVDLLAGMLAHSNELWVSHTEWSNHDDFQTRIVVIRSHIDQSERNNAFVARPVNLSHYVFELALYSIVRLTRGGRWV